jgi:hypothetical protein
MSIEAECQITAQERVLRIRRHELRVAQWRLSDLRERQELELLEAEASVATHVDLVQAHEAHLAQLREDSEKSEP